MKLTFTGVGTADVTRSIRDSEGTGLLPIQAEIGSGAGTFRLLGRVHPDAPWREIKASASAGYLESLSWLPYLRLEILTVTTAPFTVNVFVGEK